MAFDELNPYSTSGQIDSDKWINQPNQPISQQQSFDALGFYDQMRSKLGIQNTPDLLRGSEYIQQLYDIPSGMDMMNPLGHKSVPTAPSYGGKTYTDPFEFTGLSTEWAMDKFKQDLATLPQTARNDFKYAGPTSWNPTLHEAMRYYSHPSYGSLGYDPFRDNEDYFNKYGSSWGDFARSSSAHLATAMMAFKSQQTASWDMPYLSDPDTAKTFAELTSNYQSTKPGVIPFMGNLINQWGLSLGMLSGMLTDLTKMSVEGGPGGASTGVASLPQRAAKVGNWFTRMGKAASKINPKSILTNIRNGETFLARTRGVANGRKLWASTKGWLGRRAGDITPSSVSWLKNFKTTDNTFGTAGKLYQGFGAFYKDWSIANMALSESEIEAGLVQYEWEREMWDAFQKNEQRAPTLEEWDKVKKLAGEAAKTTALINFPIIYFSNLVTFNTLFKRGLGPRVINGDREIMRNAVGKVVLNPKEATAKIIERGFLGSKQFIPSLKPLLTPKAWGKGAIKFGKNFVNYAGANFMEGVQEILQETTSEYVRDAYTKAYMAGEADPELGGFYDMVFNNSKFIDHGDLDAAIGKYMSAEGLEVFMSGFAMGTLNVGASKGITGVLEAGQYAANKGLFKSYAERQATIQEQMKKSAANFASNPFRAFDPHWRSYVRQTQLQKDLEDAVEMGDEKDANDINDEKHQDFIISMLEAGKYDVIEQYLEDLKNLTFEEFQEGHDTEFKTDEERIAKIDSLINESKKIKENYEEAEELFPQRYNPNRFVKNTPEQRAEALTQIAHREVIRQYVFAKSGLRRAVKRYNTLLSELAKYEAFQHIESSDVNAIITPDSLDDEIQLLEDEIEAISKKQTLKGPDGKSLQLSANEKKELDAKSKKAEFLRQFKTDIDYYFKLIGEETVVYEKETKEAARYTKKQIAEQKKALKNAQKSFTKYIKHVSDIKDKSKLPGKSAMLDAFIKLKDMYELKNDEKLYSTAVNYLSNPEVYQEQQERFSRSFSKLHAINQISIMQNIQAFYKKMEDSALTRMIHAQGYFLDEDNMKRVFEDFKLPRYVISLGDNKIHTKGSEGYNKIKALIKPFLEELRLEGITLEEAEERLRVKEEEAKKKREAAKAAEKAEKKKQPSKKSPETKVTYDNAAKWSEIDPSFNAKAEALLKKINLARIENGLEPYASLQDAMDKKDSQLRKLVREYTGMEATEEEVAGEERFYDEKSLSENLDKWINIVQEHQDLIKPFKTLSAKERKEYGVAKGEHGYLVNVKGKWVKAVSVTSEMGTTFTTKVGNTVRLPDGREGEVTDVRQRTRKGWLYTIKLDDGETVELQTGQFRNITYEASTIVGTATDVLGRAIFSGETPEYKSFEISEGSSIQDFMSKKAFDKIVKDLTKVYNEYTDPENGWVFIAKDMRFFVERGDKKPLAGEVDLLLYNLKDGRIKVLDFKTSKATFKGKGFTRVWENLETGVKRSKKEGYALQQSIYANMIEQVTNAEVDSIGLLGVHISLDDENQSITDVISITEIPLERSIEADAYVAPNFEAEMLNEPFEDFIDEDRVDVFDDIMPRSVTTVELFVQRLKRFHLLPPTKKKVFKRLNINPLTKPKVFTLGGGFWYKMTPYRTESVNVSTIAADIHDFISNLDKKILSENDQAILSSYYDKKLSKEERDSTVIALGLGLPETAKGDYTVPVQIGDRTFYTNDSNIAKFIDPESANPDRAMFIVQVDPYLRESAYIPESNKGINKTFDEFTERVEDENVTQQELDMIQQEATDHVKSIRQSENSDKLYNLAMRRKNQLDQLIAERRKQAREDLTNVFETIEEGMRLILNEEFADRRTLTPTVTVTKKSPKSVEVEDADGKKARINLPSFQNGNVLTVITGKKSKKGKKAKSKEEVDNINESKEVLDKFTGDSNAVNEAKKTYEGKSAKEAKDDFLGSLEEKNSKCKTKK